MLLLIDFVKFSKQHILLLLDLVMNKWFKCFRVIIAEFPPFCKINERWNTVYLPKKKDWGNFFPQKRSSYNSRTRFQILEIYIIVRALLLCLRNRYQDFSGYNITIWREVWGGGQIFRNNKVLFKVTWMGLLKFYFRVTDTLNCAITQNYLCLIISNQLNSLAGCNFTRSSKAYYLEWHG